MSTLAEWMKLLGKYGFPVPNPAQFRARVIPIETQQHRLSEDPKHQPPTFKTQYVMVCDVDTLKPFYSYIYIQYT